MWLRDHKFLVMETKSPKPLVNLAFMDKQILSAFQFIQIWNFSDGKSKSLMLNLFLEIYQWVAWYVENILSNPKSVDWIFIPNNNKKQNNITTRQIGRICCWSENNLLVCFVKFSTFAAYIFLLWIKTSFIHSSSPLFFISLTLLYFYKYYSINLDRY